MNKKLKIFIIFSICIFIIFIAINFKVEKLIFPGKNKHEDNQNKTHVMGWKNSVSDRSKSCITKSKNPLPLVL